MNLNSDHNFVFSYGTLKRGFPNHSIMEEVKASYIADVRTRFKYPLVQAGEWNSPFMLDARDYPDSYEINGELYEMDEKGIEALDKFEGVDKCVYKRSKIEICYASENGHSIPKDAWCYYRYENSVDLLADTTRFIPFFGKEELKKYTAVHLRPLGWRNR